MRKIDDMIIDGVQNSRIARWNWTSFWNFIYNILWLGSLSAAGWFIWLVSTEAKWSIIVLILAEAAGLLVVAFVWLFIRAGGSGSNVIICDFSRAFRHLFFTTIPPGPAL